MKKKYLLNLFGLILLGSSITIPTIALTSCSNSKPDISIPTFIDYEINWNESDLSKSTFNIRGSTGQQKQIIFDDNGFVYGDIDKKSIIAYQKELNLNPDKSKIIIPSNVENIGYAYINNELVGAFANQFSNNNIVDKNNIQQIEFQDNSKLIGIFKNAFANIPFVTNIIIPDSVRLIDAFAFYNCINLENIKFPSSLVKIGNSAFQGSFRSVDAGINIDLSYCYNLDDIGPFAFYSTNIDNVKLPDSIKIIKESTFEECRELTNIQIPNNLVEIHDFAFRNCRKLVQFIVPKTLKYFGHKVFFQTNRLKEIIFNSNILNDVYFDSYALAGLGAGEATKVVFQDKNIYDFMNADFTKRFLFGTGTDEKPAMYKSSIVYQSNPEIEATIPENPSDDQIFKFLDETRTSIIGLTMLGQYLKKLTLPSTTITIATLLTPGMWNDFIKEIDFSQALNLEAINGYAFANFKGHTIIDLSKNQKLTYLGEDSFKSNEAVTNIYLPKSIKQISLESFYGSFAVKEINFEENTKLDELGDLSFAYLENLKTINNFPQITTIPKGLFGNNKNYNFDFSILNDLTEIGPQAFVNNVLLENADLSKFTKLESIGSYAFSGCQSLKSLKFSSDCQIKTIEEQTFYNCKSLKNLELPNLVTEIKTKAFALCSNLSNVTINNACKTIATDSFEGTNKINTITLNWDDVTNVQLNQCFKNYAQLTGTNTLTINVKNDNIKQYIESQEGCKQFFGTITFPNNINIVIQ